MGVINIKYILIIMIIYAMIKTAKEKKNRRC